MAITAYNHGIAGMLRAQRRKGSYEAIFKEYRSRIFKFASRNFYAEFLAAREVAQNYRKYFGALALDTPLQSQEVVMAGYGSLPQIARELKLAPDVLRELNPALRNPVIRGQKYIPKGFRLRLPLKSGQDWEGMMAELAPKIYKNYQKRSHIYTVQRGDTAGEIARLHGVKLRDLIAANNLNSRATIYVNQNLRIPQPAQEKSGSQSSPVLAIKKPHDSEEKDTLELSLVEPATGEARKAEPPLRASQEADLVEEQQTVVSQDHKEVEEKPEAATLPELDAEAAKPAAQAPEINPEVLQGNFAIERIWHDQGKPIGTIRVEVEETLGHYAEWLGITAWEIRRLNGFAYGKAIRLDQQIKIPLHQVSKEKFEEKRFEYHKELSEDFFATYRVEKVKFYYIKKGDTIWDLSLEEFEVPLWLIKKYNGDLDFSALVPSQKLLIPIIEKNV
jgi:membrane-bound lytic murein transglycosylase D